MSTYSYDPDIRYQRQRSRRSWSDYSPTNPDILDVKVGNRKDKNSYESITVSSSRDAGAFKRLCAHTVAQNPKDALVISVNGYRSWLHEVFSSCISLPEDSKSTNREAQYCDTVKFPQKADQIGKNVPYTFIIYQMNVPEVYFWTFGARPPKMEEYNDVDAYRFRTGVWFSTRNAYKFDSHIPVVILFIQPSPVSETIVCRLIYPRLYKLHNYWAFLREGSEGLAAMFMFLYNTLTNWQNIIRDIERRLVQAEADSQNFKLPVKLRARSMFREVDRMYELNTYLQIQLRSFQKLAKMKVSNNTKKTDEHNAENVIWDQVIDRTDDLEHYSQYMSSLKERFNNLINLEFNIASSSQADNGQFLSTLGTLILPISFLGTIWGITKWSSISYLEVGLPLFIICAIFTISYPTVTRKYQNWLYPRKRQSIPMKARNFTMLGQELPDSSEAPADIMAYVKAADFSGSNQESMKVPSTGVEGVKEKRSRSRRTERSRSRSRRRDSRQ